MPGWDYTTDLLLVGSGGGMVGALRAKALGKDAIVIEKTDMVGGSTGMSGGVVWIPNNPLMAREGVPDSFDEALTYFDTVVGPAADSSPASSTARRKTYLHRGIDMFAFLETEGIQFRRCEGYSDYYSGVRGVEGGSARSRSIEAVVFDTNRLGTWAAHLRPPVAGWMNMYTGEAKSVSNLRTAKGMTAMTRVLARTASGRVRGKRYVTNGAALVAHLLSALLKRDIPVWINTTLVDLVVEEGRVVGAVLERDGRTVRVRARDGVLLAAGGFSRNPEMRAEFSANQPGRPEWSSANPGDTGEVIRIAMAHGAATDMMDEAWWIPSWITPSGKPAMTISERSKPGSIMVDSGGNRFTNEAAAYQETGQQMFARELTAGGAIPSWLIIDSYHRSRYTFGFAPPGKFPKELLDSGTIKQSDTLEGLAEMCGIDAETLCKNVSRFNGFAVTGIDEDFHRGEGDHERYQGDITHKPNPSLGPIARAPFYAVQMYPGDIGTNGGLLCDENARVLTDAGEPIPGLYAAGNCTASVMGRKYLGAGATIGPSAIFAYVAANHAAAE
ncbi:FAD-binding protein [Tomitella biformata]|uniref:FAD-binding protein n=1 Tax=Tomitella biformata TaxID=630403 RepID=UPI0004664C97|nr:FAD-binding protein [Tomitella biformata]